MDADAAAFEPVAPELVEVRVVDEHALLAPEPNDVVLDGRVVGVVEHEAVLAVLLGQVAGHLQPVGEHDRVADVVADGDVVRHPAVVGVHVVDREAEVAHAIAVEDVALARLDEDPVRAVADLVVDDPGPGRAPDRDAAAGLADLPDLAALDDVAANDRVLRAPEIDPEEIAFEPVALDQGAMGVPIDEDAGIHLVQGVAGAPDREPAHRHVGGAHAHDAAGAVPQENGARRAFEDEGPVDADRPLVVSRQQADDIAGRGVVQRGLDRLALRDLPQGGLGRAGPARREQQGCGETDEDAPGDAHLTPPAARRACGPSSPCGAHGRTRSNSTSRRPADRR